MPITIIGEKGYRSSNPQFDQKFDYEYPDGLDLRPNSPLHNKIRDLVMQKAYASARIMSRRHKDWNAIDHTLTAYIPADEI